MEILNTKTEKDFVVGKHAKGDPSYALEFNHVTFSYLKVKDNLKDISFRMRKGESLGADRQLSKPEIGNLVSVIDELVNAGN